eukprot:3244436-Rhodomonas_salina.1
MLCSNRNGEFVTVYRNGRLVPRECSKGTVVFCQYKPAGHRVVLGVPVLEECARNILVAIIQHWSLSHDRNSYCNCLRQSCTNTEYPGTSACHGIPG